MPFLIDLYRNDKSDLQNQYIEWSSRTFIADAPYADDTFVINNFFRDWGTRSFTMRRHFAHPWNARDSRTLSASIYTTVMTRR